MIKPLPVVLPNGEGAPPTAVGNDAAIAAAQAAAQSAAARLMGHASAGGGGGGGSVDPKAASSPILMINNMPVYIEEAHVRRLLEPFGDLKVSRSVACSLLCCWCLFFHRLQRAIATLCT